MPALDADHIVVVVVIAAAVCVNALGSLLRSLCVSTRHAITPSDQEMLRGMDDADAPRVHIALSLLSVAHPRGVAGAALRHMNPVDQATQSQSHPPKQSSA